MNELNHGMGWVPDIPSISDYTEDTPKIAELLTKTALGVRVAPSKTSTPAKSGGTATAAAAAAPALAPIVDLRANF